jgi:2'-5' RNA ligase superfamily protein
MTLRSCAATGVASSTGVPVWLRQDRSPELAGEPHPPRPFGRDELGVITVALAVCLLFDRRSERAIRALWDQLESLGVPSLRSHTHRRHVPHLSYAVLRSWDLASVTAALSGLDDGEPVDLSFDGIGLFRRGRAWLLAGAAAGLAARQERAAAAVTATGAELHKHYLPGPWLPHCSLAPRAPLAQLPVLAAAVYDVLPLHARLDRAALINSATGELWPLETLP